MHVEQCLFINCAPFENLHLSFIERGVNVLTSINGGGKTTVLSYIADAFHEIAKNHYEQSFRGIENQYYRIQSTSEIYGLNQYFIVYIRIIYNDRNIDYVNIYGKLDETEYENRVTIYNKVPFSNFKDSLSQSGGVKRIFGLQSNDAKNIFQQNLATYFPSYRFEIPQYLNNPFRNKVSFNQKTSFNFELPNPLEVVSSLHDVTEWLFDLLLDDLMKGSDITQQLDLSQLFYCMRSIAGAIANRNYKDVQFNIGPRNSGPTRIGLITTDRQWLYPSLFNMSSGEKDLFCLFSEILKQADIIKILPRISGVVLIDEIDKHLHIKLQYETLPVLLQLFPAVQFIITSHSPFLHMGLEDAQALPSRIMSLENNGIIIPRMDNPLYKEVYDMMIYENQRFADKCKAMESAIKLSQKPIIITEGKTDIIHINKAKEKLGICDIDYETLPPENSPNGDGDLKTLLEQLSRIEHKNKIIGIFDRDSNTCQTIEREGAYKCYGNNVYAFCIPVPTHRVANDQNQISIEYLFTDDEVKSNVGNGTRLFFGTEFNDYTGRHLIETGLSLKHEKGRGKDKIIENNGDQAVFDEHINNKLAKKADFAEAVRTERIQVSDASWQNFAPIFDTIREILSNQSR